MPCSPAEHVKCLRACAQDANPATLAWPAPTDQPLYLELDLLVQQPTLDFQPCGLPPRPLGLFQRGLLLPQLLDLRLQLGRLQLRLAPLLGSLFLLQQAVQGVPASMQRQSVRSAMLRSGCTGSRQALLPVAAVPLNASSRGSTQLLQVRRARAGAPCCWRAMLR